MWGTRADFMQLRPDFLYIGSVIVIAVRHTFAAQFDACVSFQVQRARMCGVDLVRVGSPLRFVNLHFDPVLARPELRRRLDLLQATADVRDGIASVAGYFNMKARSTSS